MKLYLLKKKKDDISRDLNHTYLEKNKKNILIFTFLILKKYLNLLNAYYFHSLLFGY